MKRFFVFILLGFFLIAGAYTQKNEQNWLKNYAKVQIFVQKEQNFENLNYVKNGMGYIVFCNSDEEKTVENRLDGVVGKTYIFDVKQNSYGDIISSLNVDCVEKTSSSLLGFSSYFDEFVLINGKKVNVQAYCDGERVFVGVPMLLGSY